MSTEYFDKCLFESDPELLRAVASGLVGLLPEDVDSVAGLELGGVAGNDGLSAQWSADVVRWKVAKEYGTCRLAEGGEIRGRRLAVIEDVVTSGGQLVESCRALRERGAVVAAVLCVIDREAGGAKALTADGLTFRSLFTLNELRVAACRLNDRAGGRGISVSPANLRSAGGVAWPLLSLRIVGR